MHLAMKSCDAQCIRHQGQPTMLLFDMAEMDHGIRDVDYADKNVVDRAI